MRNIELADIDAGTKVHLKLLLLLQRVRGEGVPLMRVLVLALLTANRSHMGRERPRPEARHREVLHFALLGLVFALQGLQLGDLSLRDGATLQARTTIHVDLESALDVPLDLLTVPAVLEPFTHFKRDNFVA